jgi:endonuclease YncB( thermonuclease family)
LILLAVAANADTINGKVIRVADGDTVTLLTEDKAQISIRLAKIDAPESGQPYGNRSKQALSNLAFGKQVQVQVQTKDRYGRTVGRPYVSNLDVCEEMVRIGAAWVYRDFVIDQSLFDIENQARDAKRGIWSLSEAQQVEPWNWRRGLESGGDTPDGCVIKGNISRKGVKIYHAPGMSSYGATRIGESKGERWFCSADEAVAAGWRPPRN